MRVRESVCRMSENDTFDIQLLLVDGENNPFDQLEHQTINLLQTPLYSS